MNNFLVSIIIPTYNRYELVKGAIQNVLVQTYPKIEVVVIEDGSKSGIEEYIQEIKNKNIVYYRHLTQKGLGAARNTGTKIASGKYVAFLDDDDRWVEEKISLQIDLALKHKNESIMIYCGTCQMNNKNIVGEDIPYNKGAMIDHVFNGFSLPSSCMLMEKEKLLLIGGHSEKLISCIDHDIWMTMAINNYTMNFVPKGLIYSPPHNFPKMIGNLNDRLYGIKQFFDKWKSIVIDRSGINHWYNIERLYHLQTVNSIVNQKKNGNINRNQKEEYLKKLFNVQDSKFTFRDKLTIGLKFYNLSPVDTIIRRIVKKVLSIFK